jgi:hypothetical protein
MTETNGKAVSHGEYSEGISIETSKVIQGMSLVFAGAMTMLEAIHPKISVEPAELMCLMTGDREGLARLAEMKKAEAAQKGKEDAHETQNADVGSDDDVSASVPDAPVDAGPEKPVTESEASTDQSAGEEPQKKAKSRKKETPASSVTLDDITKAIVQKIEQDRSNNEKIGQLLKNYGVTRVSEIPVEKRKAFLTEVASI